MKTNLGQAEDKKGLAKGIHLGKVQFYRNFLLFYFYQKR